MRFIISIVLILPIFCCLGQGMEGDWRGEIEMQGVSIPLKLRITKDGQNRWDASMVGEIAAADAMLFSNIQVKGDSILLSNSQNGISFRGKMAKPDMIQGVFARGQTRLPVSLHRYQELLKRRPQTPEAPYPYDTLAVSFYNEFDKTKLAGTITVPYNVSSKLPAVVLVTGSGPQDRDETVDGHKPFKVIADYLTRRGVVVLRFDDRGVGKSKGDYPNSTIGDFSKDVIGAVDYLREQKYIDPNNIGVIGHSEGGLIALLIAGQRSVKVNFVGLLAAPAIAIDSLMVLQAHEVGKSVGLSRSELLQARAINRANFSVVKSSLSDQNAYNQIMRNIRPVFPEPTQEQQNEFKMLVTPSYRYFMRIDPVPFIRQVAVPVFAAYGTKDIQVPYAVNLESLAKNLPDGSKPVLKVYDGLNHFFQSAKTGGVAEYGNLEETFSLSVLEDLIDWIHTK